VDIFDVLRLDIFAFIPFTVVTDILYKLALVEMIVPLFVMLETLSVLIYAFCVVVLELKISDVLSVPIFAVTVLIVSELDIFNELKLTTIPLSILQILTTT
jgi:hypothetical protein